MRGIRKSFGSAVVLNGVDLEVRAQEVVVVIGPSGGGKSTLLRCANGLEPLSGGQIFWRGQELPRQGRELDRARREIGMVFQRFHLFPHLSALENVALAPRQVLGLSKPEAEKRARLELERVRLSAKSDAFPDHLSGGQAQRVAIARALAMQPALLLFDEPTSSLDPELVGEVLDAMRNLAREGRTMVVATHEMGFAREVATRVIFLEGGQVREEGSPAQVLEAPQHPRTREFLARVLNR